MDFIEKDGKIILPAKDFDPKLVFECGQCFRFDADKAGVYHGVAGGRALTVHRTEDEVTLRTDAENYVNFWHNYFDLAYDYAAARRRISIDPYTALAAEYGRGIRILNQEFWETLCSFIISACNNISRIKSIVARLCDMYGDDVTLDGITYKTFPSAKTIAALEVEDLAPLRSGYRAAYILAAAKMVAEGAVDIEAVKIMSTDSALKELKKLPGVGQKVASCVLLFGVGKRDAFPIDTWMVKALTAHYPPGFDGSAFAADAGLAQQYIFHHVRTIGECERLK